MAFNVSITPQAVGYIYVVNSFFSGTITDVTFNGVSISNGGASFPLNVGDATSGSATAASSGILRVFYDSAYPSPQNIQVYDNASNSYCFVVAGTGSHEFFSVTLGAGQQTDVYGGDNACP
jgi:hypothetical protein